MGKNKTLNRALVNTNKHLSWCTWCGQQYCRCCTNDGCDPVKFCSTFCELQKAAEGSRVEEKRG